MTDIGIIVFSFFFFKDTATTEIYTDGHTLSLHDALPVYLNLALADNAQQKAFVTGPVPSPLPPNSRLSEASVEVFVNGQPMERASGAAVMGDPVEIGRAHV